MATSDPTSPFYDSGWITPSYGPNYTSASVKYRRIGKVVYLRGQASRNSGTPTSGDVIFTLPVGFRPALDNPQMMAGSSTNYGKMNILSSTGEVNVATSATGGGYLLLNNITFTVD